MSICPSLFNALEYEEGMQKTVPFFHSFYTETVDLVKQVQPHARNWLDTGCRTGNLLRLAYPAFRNVRFMITDPSQEMLMQARLNLAGIPPTQLLVAGTCSTEELELTGFPCPQVITAILAHDHLSKEQRINAIKNCYEILEAQGVYISFESIRPATEEGLEIGRKRWISFQMSQGKSEQEAIEHTKNHDSIFFPITVDDHIEILKDAGFKMAELFWLSHMQAGFYAIKA